MRLCLWSAKTMQSVTITLDFDSIKCDAHIICSIFIHSVFHSSGIRFLLEVCVTHLILIHILPYLSRNMAADEYAHMHTHKHSKQIKSTIISIAFTFFPNIISRLVTKSSYVSQRQQLFTSERECLCVRVCWLLTR